MENLTCLGEITRNMDWGILEEKSANMQQLINLVCWFLLVLYVILCVLFISTGFQVYFNCFAKLANSFGIIQYCMLCKVVIGKSIHSVKWQIQEFWELHKFFCQNSLIWQIFTNFAYKTLQGAFLLNSQVLHQNRVQYQYLLTYFSHSQAIIFSYQEKCHLFVYQLVAPLCV